MHPNTPHFVVTVESAICHGRHFYAMLAIRDTIFGIYHMFCCSNVITNTKHSKDSQLLICRMVIYLHHIFVRGSFNPWSSNDLQILHVPDLYNMEGHLDIFYLCILADLGELLNLKAYEKVQIYDKEVEAE